MQRVTVLSQIILPYAIVSKEQEGGLAVKGQKSLLSYIAEASIIPAACDVANVIVGHKFFGVISK